MTEWTGEERARLEELRTTPTPPDRLETKTIERLRAVGLIRRRHLGTWLGGLGVAAAFVLGLVLGAARNETVRPGYLLLLEGGVSPEEDGIDERVHEYAAWARALRADGVAITGERLTDTLQRFGANERVPPDIRGYFLFEAESEERAVEIASSCPHLRYGGAMTLGRIAR